jgi:hypothetical protein
MRIYRAFLALTAVSGLWFGAGMALADDTVPSKGAGVGDAQFCKDNPEKCEKFKEKRDAFCKDNPEKCEEWKQKRAERQQFCKENPKKCEEQRAAMKERRAEIKAKCEADPEKCDQIKQQARERFKERHGMSGSGSMGRPGGAPGGSPGQQGSK